MATRAAAKKVHLFNISPAPGSLHHVRTLYHFLFHVVQRVHSKNESEEVKGPVPEAPPVVVTTDKSQDLVPAQSPASRVDKPP